MFRHYFAIHSFAQVRTERTASGRFCALLSDYLGHHDMDETEKYLKFSGDMFPEYIELFKILLPSVFVGGGI